MKLQGRIALVTGASRGVGREIALGYAREGAHVVLAARDEGRLEAVAREIRAVGGVCSVRGLDVADLDAAVRVVRATIAQLGRLDVLCNNAGVSTARGAGVDVAPADFAGVHAVNVLGLYACMHAVLPSMIERRYGRIVNMGSGSAYMCGAEQGAYASSKAALNALTMVVAKEVHRHNVLVNAMSPGAVRTDMNPTASGDPAEAVPTALWLASLPDGGPTGRFYRHMREVPMLPATGVDWLGAAPREQDPQTSG